MRSKLHVWIALSTLGLAGCGLLGEKNIAEQNANVSATGCLNNSKDLITRYVGGTMTQTEWKSAFDCINKSLDFFTSFVRGSSPDAYSQNDMYTMVTKFLITNGKVRKDLMKGAFTLKAALFGGDTKEFKKEEIELLKQALSRLRDITMDLIPYLQLQKQANPSLTQLQEMPAAFKRAGDQLADFINTLPTGVMSTQALELICQELTYTLSLNGVDGLGEKVSTAKWLMFNTRRDAFEPQDWASLFRYAFSLGGVWLALKTSMGDDSTKLFDRLANDYRFREFAWEALQQTLPFIHESIAQHNGATPLPIFDHIIDQLPKGILDSVPKPILKNGLRPFVLRLLQSESKLGVDEGVIKALYGVLDDLVRNLGMVDRFYEKTGVDIYSVQPQPFTTSLNQYEESLAGADRARFHDIKTALLQHPPMVDRDTGYVRFTPGLGYSKLQQQMVVAFDVAARFIHASYGSGPDHFIESDFVTFFDDDNFKHPLYAFKLVDETIANFGKKRFRDLDIFTVIGNGDGKATYPEIVSYAILLISSGKLTSQLKKTLLGEKGIGGACPEDRGTDLMGTRWVSADCFRRNFNDQLDKWLDTFPRLRAYWATLSPDDREKAMKWLEHGARRNGYTVDSPSVDGHPAMKGEDFGSFDIQAMATILHYTESLFTRFDSNLNEVLSKSEVNSAYPIFKNILQGKVQDIAHVSIGSDFLLKGLYTYIVRYRSMPNFNLNDLGDLIGNAAQLGWWLAIYALPTTNYSTDRLGVFNIVCQLAAPDSAAQAALTKDICAP